MSGGKNRPEDEREPGEGQEPEEEGRPDGQAEDRPDGQAEGRPERESAASSSNQPETSAESLPEEPEGELTEEQLAAWEEQYFNSDDEEDEEEREYFERKARNRQRLKKGIAVIVSLALLVNVFAFWPMFYNSQAIQFIVKSRELSKNEAVAQYKQSIVVVSSDGSRGTGFLISADGYIATNHHVVEDKDQVFVKFSEGPASLADVVMSEPAIDLAIVKMRESTEDIPVLPLQQETAWEPGQHVYVIGNPLFFNFIANEGTIIGDMPVRGLDVPVIVIQAPIYRGNSGSPVINGDGEVIAVVYATTEIEQAGDKQNVGLAVPIHYLLPYLEDNGQE